jgi:hypothetical protein
MHSIYSGNPVVKRIAMAWQTPEFPSGLPSLCNDEKVKRMPWQFPTSSPSSGRPMMGSTENRFYCKSRYIKDGIVGLVIWVLRVYPWNQLSIDVANTTKQDGVRIRCDCCSWDIRTHIWDVTEVFWRQTLWVGLYVPRSGEAVSKRVGNGP